MTADHTSPQNDPADHDVERSERSVLDVENLTIEVATAGGWARVVSDVSFSVPAGRIVGLVGESGSGKTLTCSSILRLHPPRTVRVAEGRIVHAGRDLLGLSEKNMRAVRGSEISMIFQEPMTSLNPVFTIGDQIAETVRAHRNVSRTQARARAVEVLDLVGIPNAATRLRDYPHQFSGGMRQRVMIAMALATSPKLLIADEPTTALDVTIQAQVLDLIRSLAEQFDMGVLLVTHDLGVVADVCDEVVVMYAGQVAESAPTEPLYEHPRHPYTEALMLARPNVEGRADLHVIPGGPPPPGEMPAGCHFQPRCSYAQDECSTPVALVHGGGRTVRCRRADALSLRGCS